MNAVNSWNEWDPLAEVIVGTCRGAGDIAYEPALSPWFPAGDPGRRFQGAAAPSALADMAERQIDGFVAVLEGLGVRVRRPDPLDQGQPFATPDWSAPRGRAIACPRDLLLVIGDEIIEAPMGLRARWFEFRAYRTLIADYFRAGARWTAAPKPLLADASWRDVGGDPAFDNATGPVLTELEPVFDAASFARFGRDIFWQPDMVSNAFGAAWLARHLGPGFRVHRIPFREPTPTHIDTTLVPIRPGLVLTNPGRPCLDDSMAVFERNGWQVVPAPPSVRSGRAPSRDVSNWISLNILMLDPRTAVVEAAETPMIDLLRSLGCDVIPCAFDSVYPFGGGFHCCTADVRREGALQSYFPSLDEAG